MFDAKGYIKKMLDSNPEILEEDIIELVECLRMAYNLETNWSPNFNERVKEIMSKLGIFKIYESGK